MCESLEVKHPYLSVKRIGILECEHDLSIPVRNETLHRVVPNLIQKAHDGAEVGRSHK